MLSQSPDSPSVGKLKQELDGPVSQFLTATHTLATNFVKKQTRLLFNEAFSRQLCYLTYIPTGVTFLADTGSVPNLINIRTSQTFWPRSYKDKQNIHPPSME